MDNSLNDWSLFDLGLIAQSIMLAAEDYGLNTAVAVQFVAYTDVIRAELNIPEHLKIVIGISLGYGDLDHLDNRCRSMRRPIGEVVVFKND
jgi:nitroreductase